MALSVLDLYPRLANPNIAIFDRLNNSQYAAPIFLFCHILFPPVTEL
jgi:hypothetical protein